jgi:hypothetical protein
MTRHEEIQGALTQMSSANPLSRNEHKREPAKTTQSKQALVCPNWEKYRTLISRQGAFTRAFEFDVILVRRF